MSGWRWAAGTCLAFVVSGCCEDGGGHDLPPLPTQANLYRVRPIAVDATYVAALGAELGLGGEVVEEGNALAIHDGRRHLVVETNGAIHYMDLAKFWTDEYTIADPPAIDPARFAGDFLVAHGLLPAEAEPLPPEPRTVAAPNGTLGINHWRVAYRAALPVAESDGSSAIVVGAHLEVLVGEGEVIGFHRVWHPAEVDHVVTLHDRDRALALARESPLFQGLEPNDARLVYHAVSSTEGARILAPYFVVSVVDSGHEEHGSLAVTIPASDESPPIQTAPPPVMPREVTPRALASGALAAAVGSIGLGPIDIMSGGWSMTATVSDDDGPVLTHVAYNGNPLARSISVPWVSWATEDAPATWRNDELRRELLGADADGNPSMLLFHHGDGSFTLVAWYSLYNSFPRPGGVPTCDSRQIGAGVFYAFGTETSGCAFDSAPCVRYAPQVYVSYSANRLQSDGNPCPTNRLHKIDVGQRFDFDLGTSGERTAFVKDPDSRPGSVWVVGGHDPPAEEMSATMARRGAPGDYDNFHAKISGFFDVWVPGCTGLPLVGDGGFRCAHSHWRWAQWFGPDYGDGRVLAPDNQTVVATLARNPCVDWTRCDFDPGSFQGLPDPITLVSTPEPIGTQDPDIVLYVVTRVGDIPDDGDSWWQTTAISAGPHFFFR